MASPKIKFKRSAVASKRPSLGSLELGELALNTYDGKLFTRRDTSGVGIATTVSTINPWTENYGSSGISYDGNISVTGISTLGQQRFANATQQNFVQLYTGGASGSYFTQGEYQKIATITPDGNSQNYTFIIRLTATSASNYQIVTFSGGLRSNTLPNLSYTVNYSEEHNGVQFIEPKLWTKETATAGFILAFEYIHSSNLYGGVNVEAIIIPRSNAQRENVDFNTTQDSEQSSIDSGFTERDPTLTLSTENSIITVSDINSTRLNVTGLSTFAGNADFNGNIDVDGHTELDNLKVTGVSTLSGNVNLSGDITSNVTIVSTDAGSSAAPEFKLYRNSASPADADYLGQIKFAGESDTGVERNYAKITGKISDASNGTEDGIIEIAHIKAGSQNISARFKSTELMLMNGTKLSVDGTSTFTGNILANSDSTVDIGTNSTRFANVYADTYYGDGSQLTGINAGAGGTENVSSNTTISGIITASDQFYPPTLTTTERDALTVTQGALIFNTTEDKVQMYLGSEWKSLAFELDTYTAVGL